jgi:hypothetical protein
VTPQKSFKQNQDTPVAEQPPKQSERGIAGIHVCETTVESFEWEKYFHNHDWINSRWEATQIAKHAAESYLQTGEDEKSAIMRLLSAVISMRLTGNPSQPFAPLWQDGHHSSPHTENLNKQDALLLTQMAHLASDNWLKARLADVATVVGPKFGGTGWEIGKTAARAYLEYTKKFILGEDALRAMDTIECLRRSLQLGWIYAKKDSKFQQDIWGIVEESFDNAVRNKWLGLANSIADEILDRRRELAAASAQKMEKMADSWILDTDPHAFHFASIAFKKSAKLWHAARNSNRSKACYYKAAHALIEKSRQKDRATVKADWMSEGIALLRRHGGDRELISKLQIELSDTRQHIQDEMHIIEHSFDAEDLADHIKSKLIATTFPAALLEIAFSFSEFKSAKELRDETLESSEKYAAQRIFHRVFINENGVPVARSAPTDKDNNESIEDEMILRLCQYHHPVMASVAIPVAINTVTERFELTLNHILQVVDGSPCSSEGHQWSIARGLFAGLQHDWREAATFLIPQAEAMVRSAFKRLNVNTLSVKPHGEEEKSLNELLDHAKVSEVIHPDIVIQLKSLLTHRAGHNLRNLFGHGLMKDDDLLSPGTVVLWWTILRLVLWPYRDVYFNSLTTTPFANHLKKEC